MKTIYIHASIHFGGGVGSVVKQLALRQLQNNDEVYLATIRDNPWAKVIAEQVGAKMLFLKDRPFKFMPKTFRGNNLKKVYDKIKRENKDAKVVMICHGVGVVGLLGKVDKKNTFVVLHGHLNKGGFVSDVFYSALFRRFKKLKYVACSNECAVFYRNKFKIEPHVILNGCDTSGEKRSYYPEKGDLCVGMVSYLDEHKGYKYLLDAAKYIDYKKTNVRFYFVGGNADGFDFDEYAENNGLQPYLKYCGKVADAANTIMTQMDLVVLPSVMEGLPMALIEALSYGIPILATNVGGIPDILKDGYDGYFIERDGRDIAEKIERCYDAQTYRTLSKNALALYKDCFSADVMCLNYDKFIKENSD